jgi:glycogen debranching enzyme
MSRTVSILEGNTFVVSDLDGNIDASPTQTHGLFQWDTRFLSRWRLSVNGTVPGVLSTDDLQYFSARFFLVPGTGTIYADSDLSIIRTRAVGDGFHEDLEIINHRTESVDLDVRIEAAADFADLFEIKDALAKKGECYSQVEPRRLVLGYRRERYVRETWIYASQAVTFDETGISVRVHLEPQEEWRTCLDVVAAVDGYEVVHDKVKHGHGDNQPRPDMGMDLDEWMESAPKLTCDWVPLERIYRRSLVDLAALRFFTLLDPDKALPAAGLPWFMTIFGRDSILTSLQALPFTPGLAASTLRVLAEQQGRHDDPFRDEEPGKIIHEFRFGEMTAFEERPHSPYFGAADGTPLFLILMDEYERWTGDSALVRELEVEARAALNWIDEYGDRNGDGYVDYNRRNVDTGLENQCWKDSPNSILFANGENSKLPRALCEIQGYVYDAKMRTARLARTFWNDYNLAARLELEAADLKRRFNEDFWLSDREFFALAIDGEGRKVDSLTSNVGHLLWSGIVDTDKAEACARHLMSDALYSGWGVRTMASTERGYNPVGYHIGTVWPHDNSFIAWGLTRYGFRAEAARLAMGILQAASFFHYRLPEAFAGYPRQRTQFPVEYPTACSPQAWATGAPLLFLRTMLGLEPVGDQLLVDPAVPRSLVRIDLLDIPGRWGHADAFGRGRIAIPEEGLEEPYLAIHLA